jgi:predicted GIY-YIG superfamily endonuclease
MIPHVYIFECHGGSYHIGSTTNLARRIAEQHQGTASRWTASRRPIRVAFSQKFPSLREAFEVERQIKGWRRAKKAALIRGDWELLPALSRTSGGASILRQAQDDIKMGTSDGGA